MRETERQLREVTRKRSAGRGQPQLTVAVGALARFEQTFGLLWGHGKPEADRSAAELVWYRLWRECRDSILDHAHNQM